MKFCLIYNFAQHYRKSIFTLVDENMEIDFYFGDKMEDVKKLDYDLFKNKVKEVHNVNLGPFLWQKDVIKLVFKKYDTFIMLGQYKCFSTWIILVLARALGKRVFFWSHGWYGKETPLQKVIKKVFFGLANGTMLYGNYARDLMIKEGLNPYKLTVIYNSLAYDKQLNIRRGLIYSDTYISHFGNSLPNVVFVGRFTKVKKLHLLIEALSISKKQGYLYNLTFIGDGEERNNLLSLTESKDVSKQIWFYGLTYDEKELSNLLYNADLCVAPGNIGLTAMHAMVYGCPCISHNDFTRQMPEFEAIKEGVTGSFFQYGDTDNLASCINNWFSLHINDREVIRKNCYKEIEEHWNPHVQFDIIKHTICYD